MEEWIDATSFGVNLIYCLAAAIGIAWYLIGVATRYNLGFVEQGAYNPKENRIRYMWAGVVFTHRKTTNPKHELRIRGIVWRIDDPFCVNRLRVCGRIYRTRNLEERSGTLQVWSLDTSDKPHTLADYCDILEYLPKTRNIDREPFHQPKMIEYRIGDLLLKAAGCETWGRCGHLHTIISKSDGTRQSLSDEIRGEAYFQINRLANEQVVGARGKEYQQGKRMRQLSLE